MSALAAFVSRKMIAALAVFALVAVTLAGVAAARAAGEHGTGSDVTADLVDPQAFQAALDDPGSAVGGSADESGTGSVAGAEDASGRSKLRSDLRAAFALQGDARREALAKIRTNAEDGAYGDAIQRRADRRQIRQQLFLDLLPDNLQADLTKLKDTPEDQRPALRQQILDRALAGGYGPDVQKAAEQLRDLRRS